MRLIMDEISRPSFLAENENENGFIIDSVFFLAYLSLLSHHHHHLGWRDLDRLKMNQVVLQCTCVEYFCRRKNTCSFEKGFLAE